MVEAVVRAPTLSQRAAKVLRQRTSDRETPTTPVPRVQASEREGLALL